MAWKTTSAVVQTIRSEARAAHPRECCGILLGEGDRIAEARPCANVHPDPARHFEIDPAALVAAHKAARRGGPQVLGYYHSHPQGPARPSATDRAMAAGDGRVWAIAAGDRIGWWRDGKKGFAAVEPPIAS